MALTDIEIANQVEMQPITEVAKSLDISDENLIPYGKYNAKVDIKSIDQLKDK